MSITHDETVEQITERIESLQRLKECKEVSHDCVDWRIERLKAELEFLREHAAPSLLSA